jgi:hypothetical protein
MPDANRNESLDNWRPLQCRSAEHCLGVNRLISITCRGGARRSECQFEKFCRGLNWMIGLYGKSKAGHFHQSVNPLIP